MARLTWFSMNWESRQALRGRRRPQLVSPGGNSAGVADEFLHQQGHEQLPVQPGPGAVLVVLGQMAEFSQRLEALEHQFDLPPRAIPLEHVRSAELGRRSIEELYKISKQLLTVEEFHGQTERTVQQELFAHCSLIALARLFTNRSEESFRADPGKPVMQANFKSSLRTVARHLEGLFLEHAAMLGKTVERILAGIAACRQRQRPNRSFPRLSRKPASKWRSSKATATATTA